jgi:hypothetical protein
MLEISPLQLHFKSTTCPSFPLTVGTLLTFSQTPMCTTGKTRDRSQVTHRTFPFSRFPHPPFSKSRHTPNSLIPLPSNPKSTFQATTVTTALVSIPFIPILRSSSPHPQTCRWLQPDPVPHSSELHPDEWDPPTAIPRNQQSPRRTEQPWFPTEKISPAIASPTLESGGLGNHAWDRKTKIHWRHRDDHD